MLSLCFKTWARFTVSSLCARRDTEFHIKPQDPGLTLLYTVSMYLRMYWDAK